MFWLANGVLFHGDLGIREVIEKSWKNDIILKTFRKC